jgi:integrase
MFSEKLQNKINNYYEVTTINCLKTCIRNICNHFNIVDVVYDKSMILNNIDEFIEYIKGCSISKAKHELGFIVKLLDFEDIQSKKLTEVLKEYYQKDGEERSKKKNEKLVEIDAEKIYKYFKDTLSERKVYLDKRNPNNIVERSKLKAWTLTKVYRVVLFSILSDVPVRLTELTNMRFQDNGIDNYIDFEKKQLVIRNHKNTKKGAQTRYVKLKDRTIDDIKIIKDKFDQTYLFEQKRTDDVISMSGYSVESILRTAIKGYCKETGTEYVAGKMGIHGWRHNAVTKQYAEINIKLKEVKDILNQCNNLGHTVSTQLKDYIKDM